MLLLLFGVVLAYELDVESLRLLGEEELIEVFVEVILGDLVEEGDAALWAVEDELEVHDLLPETQVLLLEVVDLVRESVGHGLLESFEVLLGEVFDRFLHGVEEVVDAF